MKNKALLINGIIFLQMRRIIFTLMILFTTFATTKAQILDMLSNPQITVNLVHPPNIGLKINKVAFAPAAGDCSDQIISALISDFSNNNIEVVNHTNLSSMMRDHKFSSNGLVDRSTAASINKILGPSALIVVRVQRCAVQRDKLTANVQQYDSKTKKKYTAKVFYSKSRAFLKATVQTVDLASGRTFAAQTFEYSPEKINQSLQGYPEFPSDFDVQDVAFKLMVWDVHRMFITWTEPKTLYFYDDKDCGMKLAYQALKNNDLEQAFNLSQEALDKANNTPGTKEKILEHANYNMGMCFMFRNDYDKALEYLRIAAKLRPGMIINDAITSCLKSRDLYAAMQQIDDKAIQDEADNQQKVDNIIKSEVANSLTNADVIDMTKKKLAKSIIMQKIKTSKCKFTTTPSALTALSKAGVQQDVILLMMDKTN